MNNKTMVLHSIRYKQFNGKVTFEERKKKGYLQKPSFWKKERSPRNQWIQGVTTGMRARVLINVEWMDREELRSKIVLCTHKTCRYCNFFMLLFF